ncbi:MAG: PaaI family thioesterase [Acidimicrobiia bacterium]
MEPVGQILRDLCIQTLDAAAIPCVATMPAVPEICAHDGGITIGVLGTLIDVVGGTAAINGVHPDWIATADAAIHRFAPVTPGDHVTGAARIVRRGTSTVVTEIDCTNGANELVANATMTFAVLPQAGQPAVLTPTRVSAPPEPERGLSGPLATDLGIEIVDDALLLPIARRVRNPINALQGGVVAMLHDLAATHAAGGGTVTELTISYLAPARVGPVRAIGTVHHHDPHRSVVGIECVDDGAEQRLSTRGTAVVAS